MIEEVSSTVENFQIEKWSENYDNIFEISKAESPKGGAVVGPRVARVNLFVFEKYLQQAVNRQPGFRLGDS